MNKIVPIVTNTNYDINHNHLMFNKNQTQEIVVSLFSECNLRCKFCFQKNIERLKWNPNVTEARLRLTKQSICNVSRNRIKIKLAGGELFQDQLIEKGSLNDYQHFIDEISEYIKTKNKSCYFTITTNMILKKHVKEVISFIKQNNIEIICSYDFDGRFPSQKHVKLFCENVELFHKNGIDVTINFVVTKKAVDMLTYQQNHELVIVFNELYRKYPINYEYYTNMNIAEYDMSEKELGYALISLYKLYPELINLKIVCNSQTNISKSCSQTIWIDNTILYQCCDHKKAVDRFIKNKQCFTCMHFYRCQMSCPRIFSNNKDCHLKILYDYLNDQSK